MKKYVKRLFVLFPVSFLLLGSASIANAAPTPGQGPSLGGSTVTVQVPARASYTQVTAGYDHSVAIGGGSNTYAWGSNDWGQLGDGSVTTSHSPVRVLAPTGVKFTQVFTGGYHSLAIGDDGNTYAWGWNAYGQLGDNTTTNSSTPVLVQTPAGVKFTHIAAGLYHSLAIGDDGNTYAWGFNGLGQLGDGTTTDSSVPVRVQAPTGVKFSQLFAGHHHSLATGDDGNMYAWGYNAYGQLGDGSGAPAETPVRVQAPAGVTFTQAAAGASHSVALGSDGNTYAWGQNSSGQLGDGSTTGSDIPVHVQTPAGVTFTRVAAGNLHSVALDSTGNVYTWGWNALGQLGDGSTTDSTLPVQSQPPAGVTFTDVSAGSAQSVALASNGDAYAWGGNNLGQLGDGTTTPSNVPVCTQALSVVVVTGVNFGSTPGTNIIDGGSGAFTVVTAAHPGGIVDITIEWTLNGTPQPPVVHPNAYTFTGSSELRV